MPLWISDAKLYPLASAAGDALRTFSPKGMKVARDVAPALADAVTGETVTGETMRGDDTPAEATPDPAIAAPRHRHPTSGYPYEQRRALDDIVEQSR
jgi:hypothetical protein